MAKEFGPMDINFHERCVKPNGHFDRIYYGHWAKDYNDPGAERVYDLNTSYAELSRGGRRPGNPIENERSRHFFNKRIMTDEERQAGQVREVASKYGPRILSCGVIVQGGGDVGGIGARDGEGGASSAQEVEATTGRSGCGDRDDKPKPIAYGAKDYPL